MLILPDHWIVDVKSLQVSGHGGTVVSCGCKMRVHAATLDVSDLSDRGILKNDFFFFSKLCSYGIDDFLPVEVNMFCRRP